MGTALVSDRDWAAIDSQICRVTNFNPVAQVEDGKIVGAGRTSPYALISMEIPGRPESTGAITHRTDFLHLWKAFREIGLDNTLEVNVAWIKSSLRPPAKWLAAFMPGLAVMVCRAGAFELITTKCQSELARMARFEAERPLVEFKAPIYD